MSPLAGLLGSGRVTDAVVVVETNPVFWTVSHSYLEVRV
jgi:hypothetical protein